MSCILSISSHYSPLCCWKRAVSVAFCSSSSFRVSHLLCSGLVRRLRFMQGVATWGGNLTWNWTTTYSVVAEYKKKTKNCCRQHYVVYLLSVLKVCLRRHMSVSYACTSFNCPVLHLRPVGDWRRFACIGWYLYASTVDKQSQDIDTGLAKGQGTNTASVLRL